MKAQLAVYMLILMSFSCSDKKQECKNTQVRAFTHYKFGIGQLNQEDKDYLLQVYDKPNGNVIGDLTPAEETGHIVNIVDAKDSFFKIEFSFPEETNLKINHGWVKKGTLGLVTRNYDGKKVNLYSESDQSSPVSFSFDDVQVVQLLDVCNGWAYVETFDNNKSNKGWLEPEMQCGNPMTTCP